MSRGLEDTVKRLESYNDSAFPILSIYFHPILDSKTFARQLQEFLDEKLTALETENVLQNITYIEGFLEEYHPKFTDETIALFSGDTILFEIIHLPYVIENTVYISHSPFLEPLLTQQESYRRFLVVLVDQEKANFFTLVRGMVEDKNEVFDPSVPQNVHADATEANNITREDKINRHIQDHLHKHFALIGNKIETFVGNKHIDGVILGGHKQMFHQFAKYLPEVLQEKIVGTFVSELYGNINEVVEKSKEVIKKVNTALNHEELPYQKFS